VKFGTAAIVAGWLVLGLAGDARAQGTLELVGRHDLGARGMNAALAIGDHCAYVGSRSDDPPLILDIADPAHPEQVGELAAHAGSTSRELRVAPAAHLLVVMHYALKGRLNQFDFYHWDADCRRPVAVGTYGLGDRRPHEFYLWQDPARPDRVLLFVTVPRGRDRNLEVIDASNPASPVSIGGWSMPAGLAAGASLHSVALSEDGRTAYLSLWTGGLLLADASDFTSGAGSPALRLITPAANALRYAPGNVHSAVPLPGRPLVVLTDEEYVPAGCPYGWARLVDVSEATRPRLAGSLQAPENDPARCRAAPLGAYTSHNPSLTPHLALITWYSAGLQVFDVSDPLNPGRVAEYRSGGVSPRRRDAALGGTAAMTWSYPVIHEGLIYVSDINQGLMVLRYQGPHAGEVSGLAFAEGNSNLSRQQAAAVSPSPSPTVASAAPSPTAPLQAAQVRRALNLWFVLGSVGAALSLAVLGVVLALRLRRSR